MRVSRVVGLAVLLGVGCSSNNAARRLGDPCATDDECASGRCSDRVCKAAAPRGLGAACSSAAECRSEHCMLSVSGGRCELGVRVQGAACSDDLQCASGRCDAGRCAEASTSTDGGSHPSDAAVPDIPPTPRDSEVDLPVATLSWPKRFGGAGTDRGTAVGVDNDGNIAVTGYFHQSADFGAGPLFSAGQADIFVASYEASGAHRWSVRDGDVGDDWAYGLAVTPNNNILLTGGYTGYIDEGSPDIYVFTYYGLSGRRVGGYGSGTHSSIDDAPLDDRGYAVAAKNGSIALAGAKGAKEGSYYIDLYHEIALGDAGGDFWGLWQTSWVGNSAGYGVAIDAADNFTATGAFTSSLTTEDFSLASAGARDIFVISYDGMRSHRWSARFGGVNDEEGRAIAVDTDGNVTIVGWFEGTTDLGDQGKAPVSAGGRDIFVASYDSSGAHRWSRSAGGTGIDEGTSVAIDTAGTVFVTGAFEGTVDFGGGPLTSAGSRDIFVASYDPAGAYRWSRRFGGAGSDQGHGVAVAASGEVFVTGQFEGTVDFDGGALTSAGSEDAFLLRVVP